MQETRETPVSESRILEIRVLVNDDDGPLTESDRVVAEQLVHRAIDRINLYRFGRKPSP
jgi:hypothetical protein